MIAGVGGCRHHRSFPQMAGIFRELSWEVEPGGAAELPH